MKITACQYRIAGSLGKATVEIQGSSYEQIVRYIREEKLDLELLPYSDDVDREEMGFHFLPAKLLYDKKYVVGDIVFDKTFGEGAIVNIDYSKMHPITVAFEACHIPFLANGSYYGTEDPGRLKIIG